LFEKIKAKNSAVMPQKKNNSKQTEVSAERNGDKSQNAYFLSLELENVRCFGEKQQISFSDDNNPKRWTIILGNNGTGKTTILQSLIAMLPKRDFHQKSKTTPKVTYKNNAFFVVTRPCERIGLVAKFSISNYLSSNTDSKTIKLNIDVAKVDYGWKLSGSEEDLDFHLPCFAYGASRKAGKTSLSDNEEESFYATLFDDEALLINAEEWLLRADYTASKPSSIKKWAVMRRDKVVEILKTILPDVDKIEFGEFKENLKNPTVKFHTHYGWVESKDLSLGYRTSMAWTVDFASRMFDRYPESENPLAEPAVVLIDEIDLHLHPKWQRELIDYLTNLFPNTQFIVTTHSPLIVQAAAARDANIVVCRREGDHVVIDQSVEAVKNWRTDQILTSDLFDLPTARPKEIEKLLKEKEEILSKPKLTKKDEARLKELDKEIGFLPVSENHEDNEAMEVIKNAADWLKTRAE
jgi:predicted ATPase